MTDSANDGPVNYVFSGVYSYMSDPDVVGKKTTQEENDSNAPVMGDRLNDYLGYLDQEASTSLPLDALSFGSSTSAHSAVNADVIDHLTEKLKDRGTERKRPSSPSGFTFGIEAMIHGDELGFFRQQQFKKVPNARRTSLTTDPAELSGYSRGGGGGGGGKRNGREACVSDVVKNFMDAFQVPSSAISNRRGNSVTPRPAVPAKKEFKNEVDFIMRSMLGDKKNDSVQPSVSGEYLGVTDYSNIEAFLNGKAVPQPAATPRPSLGGGGAARPASAQTPGSAAPAVTNPAARVARLHTATAVPPNGSGAGAAFPTSVPSGYKILSPPSLASSKVDPRPSSARSLGASSHRDTRYTDYEEAWQLWNASTRSSLAQQQGPLHVVAAPSSARRVSPSTDSGSHRSSLGSKDGAADVTSRTASRMKHGNTSTAGAATVSPPSASKAPPPMQQFASYNSNFPDDDLSPYPFCTSGDSMGSLNPAAGAQVGQQAAAAAASGTNGTAPNVRTASAAKPVEDEDTDYWLPEEYVYPDAAVASVKALHESDERKERVRAYMALREAKKAAGEDTKRHSGGTSGGPPPGGLPRPKGSAGSSQKPPGAAASSPSAVVKLPPICSTASMNGAAAKTTTKRPRHSSQIKTSAPYLADESAFLTKKPSRVDAFTDKDGGGSAAAAKTADAPPSPPSRRSQPNRVRGVVVQIGSAPPDSGMGIVQRDQTVLEVRGGGHRAPRYLEVDEFVDYTAEVAADPTFSKLRSPLVREVSNKFVSGCNTALLLGHTESAEIGTLAGVRAVTERVITTMPPTSALYASMALLRGGLSEDLLAKNGKLVRTKMVAEPLLGVTLVDMGYVQVSDQAHLNRLFARAYGSAKMSERSNPGLVVLSLILKQYRGDDVLLSSLLITHCGQHTQSYYDVLRKADLSPFPLFHGALGGPCYTVCCFTVHSGDPSCASAISIQSKLSSVQNKPSLLGSVHHFLELVDKELEKVKAEESKSGNPASPSARLVHLEENQAHARRILADPRGYVPKETPDEIQKKKAPLSDRGSARHSGAGQTTVPSSQTHRRATDNSNSTTNNNNNNSATSMDAARPLRIGHRTSPSSHSGNSTSQGPASGRKAAATVVVTSATNRNSTSNEAPATGGGGNAKKTLTPHPPATGSAAAGGPPRKTPGAAASAPAAAPAEPKPASIEFVEVDSDFDSSSSSSSLGIVNDPNAPPPPRIPPRGGGGAGTAAAAGSGAKGQTASNGGVSNEGPRSETRVRTVVVLDPACSKTANVTRDGANRLIATTVDDLLECRVDEVLEAQPPSAAAGQKPQAQPPSLQPTAPSAVLRQLCEVALKGCNAAVLVAASRSNDFASQLLLYVVETLTAALTDTSGGRVGKLTVSVVKLSGESVTDLLVPKAKPTKLVIAISPIFGSCVYGVTNQPVTDAGDFSRLLAACLKTARSDTGDYGLLYCNFILRLKAPAGDDVLVSSLGVSFVGENVGLYTSVVEKTQRGGVAVPRALYHYALGGPCFTVALLGISGDEKRADQMLSEQQRLGEVENRAVHPGSVADFISGIRTGLAPSLMARYDSTDSEREREETKDILERLVEMVKDAEALLTDFENHEPKAYLNGDGSGKGGGGGAGATAAANLSASPGSPLLGAFSPGGGSSVGEPNPHKVQSLVCVEQRMLGGGSLAVEGNAVLVRSSDTGKGLRFECDELLTRDGVAVLKDSVVIDRLVRYFLTGHYTGLLAADSSNAAFTPLMLRKVAYHVLNAINQEDPGVLRHKDFPAVQGELTVSMALVKDDCAADLLPVDEEFFYRFELETFPVYGLHLKGITSHAVRTTYDFDNLLATAIDNADPALQTPDPGVMVVSLVLTQKVDAAAAAALAAAASSLPGSPKPPSAVSRAVTTNEDGDDVLVSTFLAAAVFDAVHHFTNALDNDPAEPLPLFRQLLEAPCYTVALLGLCDEDDNPEALLRVQHLLAGIVNEPPAANSIRTYVRDLQEGLAKLNAHKGQITDPEDRSYVEGHIEQAQKLLAEAQQLLRSPFSQDQHAFIPLGGQIQSVDGDD